MLITADLIPAKPYIAYAYAQDTLDAEPRLIVRSGMTARGAQRAATNAEKRLRRLAPTGTLVSWGWQKVDADDRARGIVV